MWHNVIVDKSHVITRPALSYNIFLFNYICFIYSLAWNYIFLVCLFAVFHQRPIMFWKRNLQRIQEIKVVLISSLSLSGRISSKLKQVHWCNDNGSILVALVNNGNLVLSALVALVIKVLLIKNTNEFLVIVRRTITITFYKWHCWCTFSFVVHILIHVLQIACTFF